MIGYDLLGYPYNKKYPANVELYGPNNDGYSSPYRATLFYAFAVQHYDLEFSYRGKHYYCLSERDYVALCDSSYSKEYQRFDNANVFIETFEVEGKKLIDIYWCPLNFKRHDKTLRNASKHGVADSFFKTKPP